MYKDVDGINYFKLALVPAIISLGVTILRLIAELLDMPAWLARQTGGPALIGVIWLAPIFGFYFATKLAAAEKPYKTFFLTTLLYAYLVRIPIVVIMTMAKPLGWRSHYAAYSSYLVGVLIGQLILGVLVLWLAASLIGVPVLAILRRRRMKTASATAIKLY